MEWIRGRTIGRGSSATVSAATCQNSGEIIAVKSVELSRSECLQREAMILSSLNSPYVVGYRGCKITKEPNGVTMYNLLMEYAPYGELADAPARNGGRIDETLLVKYTRQILQGLEYIHSMGIAHCDIKGRNVLIGESGEAKMADFGCAKRVDWEPDFAANPIQGTPAFMAPEVARGERQGKESDIWAVGCTVIEMATGSPPWITTYSGDPVSVLYRIGYSGESPELPCFLTKQAKNFLKKCFKRKPEKRWTASQLLNHPFLTKPNTEAAVSGEISNSPTSVMDQRFWVSMGDAGEEEESEDLGGRNLCGSDVERIGRLCLVGSDGPTWDMEGGDWIIVRDGKMIGGSDRKLMKISGNVEYRSEMEGYGEQNGRVVFSESLHVGQDQCDLSDSHWL